MAASLSINDILTQVKRLDKEDQLTLLQQVASLLKRTDAADARYRRLAEITGLGSEIWKNTEDIDNYIDGERQW